jgi:hypothetical protein
MESARKDQQLAFRLPAQLAGITNEEEGGGGGNDGTEGDHRRYELWSVQLLGDGLTLQDLDGTHCSLDVSSNSQVSDGEKDEMLTSTSIQTTNGGNEYVLQLPPKRTSDDGPGAAANDWMRLIYPAKKKKRRTVTVSAADSSESDSDSDDDNRDQANDEFSHRPYGLPFLRHCSIISHHRPAEEPSGKDGPPAHVAIRRAYEPVPQRSGLKRRWVPFGAAAADVLASHRKGRPESALALAEGEAATTSAPNPTAIQRDPSATEGDDDMGTNPRTAPMKAAPARQEAGQATAAQPEPRSLAPSPASDCSLEHKDTAARKAAKKEAKKAAKERKKEEKKAKKWSKQEAA